MGKKSIFDLMGRERAFQLMEQGIQKAVADLHAAGLPAVGLIDGVLCKRYPDGRIVAVKDEEDAQRQAERDPGVAAPPFGQTPG